MVFDRRATETSIIHETPKDTKHLSFGAGDMAYKLHVAKLCLLQLGQAPGFALLHRPLTLVQLLNHLRPNALESDL
eukprot:12592639-Heterocapsa_arctica.AAC.1